LNNALGRHWSLLLSLLISLLILACFNAILPALNETIQKKFGDKLELQLKDNGYFMIKQAYCYHYAFVIS
jgi:ABC-type bacteriocin/lantibiotic exporter with double-glycine peptidase domain